MDFLMLIISLLGAGAGVAAHQLVSVVKKRRAVELEDYAARMIRDENEQLRSRINLVESYNAMHVKKIAELERQIFEMQHKIEIMEFAPFSIPLPMWMKNSFGVLDFINDEYEEVFLKPRGLGKLDYLGKTDFDVWPKMIAEEYRAHDQEVMNTGKTFNGRETVVDERGNETKWRVMKFARKVPRGVAGIAFPDNGYFETYFANKKQ